MRAGLFYRVRKQFVGPERYQRHRIKARRRRHAKDGVCSLAMMRAAELACGALMVLVHQLMSICQAELLLQHDVANLSQDDRAELLQ